MDKNAFNAARTRLQTMGRGLFCLDSEAGRMEADVLLAEKTAVSTQTIALNTDKLASASLAQLKTISEALTAKLTYLLEPIGLVEADADRCSVQLRSSPPQKGEGATLYYELLVRRGGDITLSRYEKRAGAMRRIVPSNLTWEVLERLLGDFEAAAAGMK